MSTWKNFPWLSFALLLITYSSLGWLLASLHNYWYAWAIVVVGSLLLNVLLSTPWLKIRSSFTRLFKSDTRAFLVAILASFLSVIIISWLQASMHALVVISAGTLFKLDAQAANLSGVQTFWILSIVSLPGLSLGGIGQTLFTSYF